MARQATPTHDAAHVLVSFQSNNNLFAPSNRRSNSSRSHRPLSLANANRPPQNRRRVWRACESCRKKKIKCDGSDPCQCCLDNGSDCVYAIEGLRRGVVAPQMNESFGKRLHVLEDLVTRLVEEQRRLAAQIAGKDEPAAGFAESNAQPDCSLELDHVAPQGDPIGNVSSVLLDEGSGNLIDPGLVQSTTQQEGDSLVVPEIPAANTDPVVGSGNVEKENLTAAFTDDYGQIYTHGDDSQYVGLGTTITPMNECSGLRTYMRRRLLQKGLQPPETILNSRPSLPTPQDSKTDSLPPVALMDTLIDAFFLNIYKLFPIIEAEDFRRHYLVLLSRNEARPGFLSLLYAILAVSARQISKSHPVWARDNCMEYRNLDLGAHFHSLAISALGHNGIGSNIWLPSVLPSFHHGTNINTVTSLTILSMYLTQAGLLNEAWIMVGQAARLGQTMGLHRSPKRMDLPMLDVRRRCQLWWCLYVMDSLLALHLGRPVAVNDHDSDVIFPSARPSAPGFVAMTHICRIIGRILRTVNSIENSRKWRERSDDLETQAKVDELSLELNNWKQNMLPDVQPSDGPTTEQSVLFSTYDSAVLLLFRPFMPTPHWKSPLSERAIRECFFASVDCVNLTAGFIEKVPACHYFGFHGLNLFISVMALLHCTRQTKDESMIPQADDHTKQGITLLSQMEKNWPLARQYKAIAEEYKQFTQEKIELGNRGRCSFEEDHGVGIVPEATFDPWREFAAQIDFESNIFPSMPDAAWMSELFQLSPSKSQVNVETDIPLPDGQELDTSDIGKVPVAQPPAKRRRVDGRSKVCGFSFKRSSL